MIISSTASSSSSSSYGYSSSPLCRDSKHGRLLRNPIANRSYHREDAYNVKLSWRHLVRSTPFPSLRSLSSTVKCLMEEEESESSEQKPEPIGIGANVEKEELVFERLFSNLNQATLKREPGSFSSAVFLVSGTTVGAGILAIPAVTQEEGFLASALVCILCWAYMVVTGLLVAEVNIKTMCELGSGGVSLVSMAKRTLGSTGVQISCWSYIFIHYALLVAYVARSSDILTNFLGIPLWESATIFSLLLGGICYFGSQRLIGAFNGVLVLGIIVSFTALVVIASGDLHWDALLKANFEAAPLSIPIIALSFVYQNVVPVICTNLEGNLSKVRSAIVLGTAIPLALFLVWNAVILGSIPSFGADFNRITDPLQQLRNSNGVVGPVVEVFSLLAIATSYIGFVLGLADFLADLLELPSGENRPLPYLLTLFPPLLLSLYDPEIFFKALDFAGTYGVLVLFGILPAAMSWSDMDSDSGELPRIPSLVPGGRFTLSVVIGGAGFVILSELLRNFGNVLQ
ncbi:tyrosine-specific transport system-like [Impatiens glandulifera]|uniref:tyrosine-specific transport system-like n=1 Tax=Impatiens glandulifera TaxID=253017 RepID=UPI001FB08C3F|nr:tyrosine-specific transport system-like [Impatiens glandulifera]